MIAAVRSLLTDSLTRTRFCSGKPPYGFVAIISVISSYNQVCLYFQVSALRLRVLARIRWWLFRARTPWLACPADHVRRSFS